MGNNTTLLLQATTARISFIFRQGILNENFLQNFSRHFRLPKSIHTTKSHHTCTLPFVGPKMAQDQASKNYLCHLKQQIFTKINRFDWTSITIQLRSEKLNMLGSSPFRDNEAT